MNLMEASPFNPYVEIVGENSKLAYVKNIKNAYEKTISDSHKVPIDLLAMNGMSGKKYRTFINNLVEEVKDARYLEIGSWKGSTACSALYGNNATAVCIDNWSQFGDVSLEFKRNILQVISEDNLKIFEQDFRQVDYSSIGKHNIYFFDGPHEEQDQYDGLSITLPALDDTFIFIVDDWNDPRPRNGTENALNDLAIEVLYSMQIRTSNGVDVVYPAPHVLENSDWHNGYFISVCKKK
jgi:hypothetical protein